MIFFESNQEFRKFREINFVEFLFLTAALKKSLDVDKIKIKEKSIRCIMNVYILARPNYGRCKVVGFSIFQLY